MNTARMMALGALMLFGVTGLATAGDSLRIDETVPAEADGQVHISNVAGMIRVIGWDREEVRVKGRYDEKVREIEIDTGDGEIDIEVILPRNLNWGGGDADLTIHVPKGSSLEVETVSAPIEVEGVEGDMELECVSGSIEVDGARGSVEASNTSGSVRLTGDMRDVMVETVSGGIEIIGVSGEISAVTVSGAIEIEGGDFSSIECESVSGGIEFVGNPVPGSDVMIEAFSGSVHLYLTDGLNARIQAETHSGDIRSDFGDAKVRRAKYGPGAWMETEVGDGSATIDISTFSGSISLHDKR